MSTIGSTEIISIIKEEIENYDVISRDQEVGYVVSVGDGIASVYGIDHAMYGEIVTLETGLKGMVQDIKQNEISCILFGDDSDIKEGTKVARTGKMAGIPVGEAYIGRIVDALGSPIDGKGEIEAADYRPVEEEAPGIVERKSVSVPLETGILSIDSMFPIGRGQRELIIGDRQTGKNVYCAGYHTEPEREGCYLYIKEVDMGQTDNCSWQRGTGGIGNRRLGVCEEKLAQPYMKSCDIALAIYYRGCLKIHSRHLP